MIKAPFWEDFEIRFCWSSNAIEGKYRSEEFIPYNSEVFSAFERRDYGTMTDAVFYPTDYKKVPELMKEISSEWNDLEGTLKEVLEKITELHFRFERIHPFEDGNGRTGRMIFNR